MQCLGDKIIRGSHVWSKQFCRAGCLCLAPELNFASLACCPPPLQFCLTLALPFSFQARGLKKHETLTPPAHSISSSCPFQDLPLAGEPGRTLALAPPSIISPPPEMGRRESVHALNDGGGEALAKVIASYRGEGCLAVLAAPPWCGVALWQERWRCGRGARNVEGDGEQW
jgi:hypothetical protein